MKKLGFYICLCGLILISASSCKTRQIASSVTKPVAEDRFNGEEVMNKVISNALPTSVLTAKMKLTMNFGDQELSIGGNLKMKKNDVIQLSLVGFGIIEGGRLEFTKDKVLILDRIHNQYTYLPYSKISFLKDADLDFNVLQSLFWNELFVPGKKLSLDEFDIKKSNDQTAVATIKDSKKLVYQFLTSLVNSMIEETRISDSDNQYTLHWKYGEFGKIAGKSFPTYMGMQVDGIKKNAAVVIRLNHLSNDSNWEPRTSIPKRYKEVAPESILKRLMSL